LVFAPSLYIASTSAPIPDVDPTLSPIHAFTCDLFPSPSAAPACPRAFVFALSFAVSRARVVQQALVVACAATHAAALAHNFGRAPNPSRAIAVAVDAGLACTSAPSPSFAPHPASTRSQRQFPQSVGGDNAIVAHTPAFARTLAPTLSPSRFVAPAVALAPVPALAPPLTNPPLPRRRAGCSGPAYAGGIASGRRWRRRQPWRRRRRRLQLSRRRWYF